MSSSEGHRCHARRPIAGTLDLTQWGQLSRLAQLHSALRGHVADPALTRAYLIAQGQTLWAQGRAADAAAPLQEALALTHATGNHEEELDALVELVAALGRLCLRHPGQGGRYGEWRAVTRQALTVARTVPDQAGRTAALQQLGDLCLSAVDLGWTRRAYGEALLEAQNATARVPDGALLSYQTWPVPPR